jgi:sodium/proline symporter
MLTFSLVLLGFLAVGWAAARRQRGATDDYYLASRNLSPLLIARLARWNYAPVLAWLAPLLGLGTAVLWRLAGWHTAFYEGAPGMLLGLGLLMLGRKRLSGPPHST